MRTASAKINFTKSAIEALDPPAPPTERRYVYDLKTPGLTVAVFNSGKKVFYLYRKATSKDGSRKPERVWLGVWPIMTVEQARDEAAMKNGEVANNKNPNEARREKRNAPTLKEAFDVFIDAPTRTRAKRPKAAKTVKEYRQQFDAYLSAWHSRPISTISRAEIEKRHNELSKTGGDYIANRTLALIKAIFNQMLDDGLYGVNPATRIRAFEEQERDRFLHADELPKFWAALEAEPSEKIRDFVKLALFTGQRRTNVAAMKWEDVSLERALWTIPQTKTGKHTVPLVPEALEVLQRRQKASGGHEYVFPAHHNGGHLKDPMRAWRDILARAGIKNLRIHDLRRTLGSWQTMGGASRPIVGKMLGHSNEATTAIYGRMDLDPVRASATSATAAIMAATNSKAPLKSKKSSPKKRGQ